MSSVKRIPTRIKMTMVDRDRLYQQMHKRGVTQKQASIEVGHAENYINSTIHKYGALPDTIIVLMQQLYNINPDDYTVKEEVIEEKEVVAEEESKSQVMDFNYAKLYKVIYSATLHAFNEALNSK